MGDISSVDVAMAVLSLCGLVIAASTIYASVQSRKSNNQLTDASNGSLRGLVEAGFKRTDGRIDNLVGRVASTEEQISDLNKYVRSNEGAQQ